MRCMLLGLIIGWILVFSVMFDMKLSYFYHPIPYLVIDWYRKLKENCFCFVSLISRFFFFFCYRPSKMKVNFQVYFSGFPRIEHASNLILYNVILWIRLMKCIKYVSDGFLMTIDFNSQENPHQFA